MIFSKKDYKYEFLPSNLEIIEKPPSPLGGFIIYSIAFMIILFIILSFVFKIDVVITAPGSIEIDGGVKIVNTNNNGKIIKINKKEGDKVVAGETILELENELDNEVLNIEKQIIERKVQNDMNKTYIDGFRDDQLFSNYELDTNLMQAFQLEYDIHWSEVAEKSTSYQKNVQDIKDRMTKENVTEEEKKQFTENLAQLELDYNNALLNSKLNNLNAYNNGVSELTQLTTKLEELNKGKDDLILKAPVDGTLLTMNYNTEGVYVSNAINVAEIVPDNGALYVNSKIANQYVSKVSVGQEVMIKVDAFEYQMYGGLEGHISDISATSKLSEDKASLNYEMKITIDGNNEKITLKPGMTVSLDIKTKRERIIDYIFAPIKKVADDAF